MDAAGRTGKRGLNIEEVFVELSAWKAHDGPGALPRVLLTPRSAKACLAEGVDSQVRLVAFPCPAVSEVSSPAMSLSSLVVAVAVAVAVADVVAPQDLKIRDIDAFWQPGLDPAVQRMRHEAYSALRHEKMKAVRTARRAIIKDIELGGTGSPIKPGATKKRSTTSGASTARSNASDAKNLLEIERRRLEKLKVKQQKEIEGMMVRPLTFKCRGLLCATRLHPALLFCCRCYVCFTCRHTK